MDVILAASTIALWLVAVYQLSVLRDTVVAQRMGIADQRRRERRELRAYVGIEEGWLDYTDPDPTLLPTALLKIVNSGLTPAMRATHRCRVTFQSIFNPQFEQITPTDADPTSVVFPRCGFPGRGTLGRHLTANELEMQESHMWATYVHGEIEYMDIYHRRQITHYRLTGVAVPGKKNPLFFCPDGNDAT